MGELSHLRTAMTNSTPSSPATELAGTNLIGNALSAEGIVTFKAIAAASGSALEPAFTEATSAELDRTLTLAATAFGPYRAVPGAERAAFLEKIADNLLALGDPLIKRAHAETALPVARLTGERMRTVGQLRLFAELLREGSWVDARIDHALPDRQPAPRPDLRRMLLPLGPVAVFGASNFPFAFSTAGGDTASALAAGCPVIVKAHPAHPGTSEMVSRAILDATQASGMPEGVFSQLHGGASLGGELIRHPLLTAAGFTGSLTAGRALFDAAAARPQPIPVYAEMGSINPVFVLPGALSERGEQIAKGLAQSVTLGVGQFCTNPGLCVVLGDEDTVRTFASGVAEAAAQIPAGTMLTRGIHTKFLEGCTRLRETASVRAVSAAHTDATPGAAAAVFTTDAAAFLQDPSLHAEVFGPVTLIVACASAEEMRNVANAMEGQLTATIQGTSDDLRTFRDLVPILETKAGRVLFNGFPTGVEVVSAMQHGGPYPATTDSRSTSVGTAAILRWVRPVCYQDAPDEILPPELQNANPLGIRRLVDGQSTKE